MTVTKVATQTRHINKCKYYHKMIINDKMEFIKTIHSVSLSSPRSITCIIVKFCCILNHKNELLFERKKKLLVCILMKIITENNISFENYLASMISFDDIK